MFEALFNFLINTFFWLLSMISNIIFYPIEKIIGSFIPNFSNFQGYILDFLENCFKYVGFIKEFMFDYFCINREVFSFLLNFIFALWGLGLSIKAILFISNSYKKIKGG